jgi:uncharacterized protein
MPEVFVDTAGWASLAVTGEPYHKQAAALYQQTRRGGRRLVTTDYVATELISLFISPLRLSHEQIVTFISKLHTSSLLDIIHIDRPLYDRSWQLFVARPDKFWSLVDCSGFLIMQERGITEALTTDQHFEQAGFVRLLK